MRNASRSIGAVLGCVILFSASCVFAQDWPQWRGANRDGKVTGFTAPQTWPKALTQKWKVTVGSGDSTPALVGDKLYVFARQGEDEVTVCLNAADGKEVWKDKYATPSFSGPASRLHLGPRSSPAVADGKVVTLGANGVVSCLDAATGKVAWRKDSAKEGFPGLPTFHTGMSPLIVDKMAIVQLGSEGNGAILAYDLGTGEQKWKWAGEGPMYASPALLTAEGAKQVVTLTSKSIVGVGLTDGKLLWQVPFAPTGMSYNAATPIVDGQTIYVSGAGRGTKALKIEKKDAGFAATELWSNDKLAVQFNTPVLKDGLLFGLTDKGSFFCINAKDGKEAWTDSAKRSRGFAAVVDAGSVLLGLPDNSELVVFKPSDKEYSEVAKIKVADTATYAHPVIAGNKVFVKDQDAVALLTIE